MGNSQPARSVDLNADLGESFGAYRLGQDADLIPLLTSANLACGFHAGDPRVMDATVRLCAENGVAVGAHPGFPDRVGFGRRVLEVTGEEAESDVLYQVAALDGFCRRHGVAMQHVKPHGALYNHAVRNVELAEGIVAGIAGYRSDLLLVCQQGSEMEAAARRAGLPVAYEGFVDRAYDPDGSLASRRLEGSLYHDPARATEQALRLVREGTVVARDGSVVPVEVDTLCVHGDNPEAVTFLRALREALSAAGVPLAPMREVAARRSARA
jgi:5-oxoprolinase (ATP-hydrolysing) subunit A